MCPLLTGHLKQLKIAIRVAHKRYREVYGTRRLQPELVADGVIAGRDRITRLRKEMGIHCKQKRKFIATTNSNHALPVAPNRRGLALSGGDQRLVQL